MYKQSRFLPPTKSGADTYPLQPPSAGFQTYGPEFLRSMPQYMAGSEDGGTPPKSPSPFGKVWQFHRTLKGELGRERQKEAVSNFRGIVALLAARNHFSLPVMVNVSPQLQSQGGEPTLLQELFQPHASCAPKSAHPASLPFIWHTRMTYFALRKNDGSDAPFAGYSPLTLVYPASKPLPPELARQIFWWDAAAKRLTDPTAIASSHPSYQESRSLRSVLKVWLEHAMTRLHTIPFAPEDTQHLSTILNDWLVELRSDEARQNMAIVTHGAFEAVGNRLAELQTQVGETLPLPEFFRWVIPFSGEGGMPIIEARRTGNKTVVLSYEQARNPKVKIFGVIFGSAEIEKRLRQDSVPAAGNDLGTVLGMAAPVPYIILDKFFEPRLSKVYEDVNESPPKVNASWKILSHDGEAYLFPFKSELLNYFTAEQIAAGTTLSNLNTGSLSIQFGILGAVSHRNYKHEEREVLDTSMDLRLFPHFAIDSLTHLDQRLPKPEDRRYYGRLRLFQGADKMWDMEWLNEAGMRLPDQQTEYSGNFELKGGSSSPGKQKLWVINAAEKPENRPAVLHVKNYGLLFVRLKTYDFGPHAPMPWEVGLDFGTSNTCLVRRKTNQGRDSDNAEILRLGIFTTSLLDQWDVDKGRASAAEGFSAIFDFPYLNNNFEARDLGVSNHELNPRDFFPTQVVHYDDRNAPSPAEPFHLRNGLAFFQNITVTSLLANQVSELIKGFDALKPGNNQTALAPPERFILNRSLKWGEDADHNNPTTINQAWRKVFLGHLRLQILMSAISDNGSIQHLRASYPKAFTSAQKESYEDELGRVWGETVSTQTFSESAAAAAQVGVKEAQVVYLIDIGGGTSDFAVFRDKGLIGECSLKLAGSFIENYFCSSPEFRQAIAPKLNARGEFNALNPERMKDFNNCLRSRSGNKEMFRTAFHGILNIIPPRALVTDILDLTGNKACTGFTLTNVILYGSLAYFAGLVQRDQQGQRVGNEAESKFLLRWVGNGSCFLKTLNRGGMDGSESFQRVLEQLFQGASGTNTRVECDSLGNAKSVVALGLLKLKSKPDDKAPNIASKIFSDSLAESSQETDSAADPAAAEPSKQRFGRSASLRDFYKQEVIHEFSWDGLRDGGVFKDFLVALQSALPRFRLGDQPLGGLDELGIGDHSDWAVEYVKLRKQEIARQFRARLLFNHAQWKEAAKNQPDTLQVEPLFITEVAALMEDVCEFCGVQRTA